MSRPVTAPANATGVERWPVCLVFVVLIGAYPVTFLAASNPGQVAFHSFASAVLVSVFATVSVWILLSRVAISRTTAAFAVGSCVLLFYSFGLVEQQAHALLGYRDPGETVPSATGKNWIALKRMLGIGWGVLMVGILLAVARLRQAARPGLLRALTVAVFGLVLLSGWRVAADAASHDDQSVEPIAQGDRTPVRTQPSSMPDIYYIVLDGYARADVLERHYGFDNSAFLTELRKLGFRVASDTTANYGWTFLSLASTLNLDYLQGAMPQALRPGSRDRREIYQRIRDNSVSRLLRERGYEYVHLRSTWGATAENAHADREVSCAQSLQADEFFRTLSEMSWFGVFFRNVSVGLAKCHLANFQRLAEEGGREGPKLVFAHFVPPHHPYLFDRDGHVLSDATVANQFDFQGELWEDRHAYIAQLEFVNATMLKTIRRLLETSRHPPIIVLASDHGPNLRVGLTAEERHAVRFANFGAYLLPGAPEGLVPESMSAVNQFRLILAHYFDLDLPALPDRHFASAYRDPYRFEELDHLTLARHLLSAPQRQADASAPLQTRTPSL